MKNYTIKLKITSEKEVAVAATNDNEALEMGLALSCDTEKLKLTSDDVVCVEGSLECPKVYKEKDFDCENIECADCNLNCEHCCSCQLETDDFEPMDCCFECEFYCKECGSCAFYEDDEDEDDDYCDEEFERRKQLFAEYISECFDEVIEYGKTLFCEE